MTTEPLQLRPVPTHEARSPRSAGRERIAIALVLLVLAAGVLLAIAFIRALDGIVQILTVVAGMLTAGFAKTLVDGLQIWRGSDLPRVRFSEVEGKLLDTGAPLVGGRASDATALNDRVLIDLLAVDPNAALAKLRMEIESALRHLAAARKMDVSNRPVSIRQLIDAFGDHLPLSERVVLSEIVRACNDAIHGAAVDQQTAARIVDAGIQVMKRFG